MIKISVTPLNAQIQNNKMINNKYESEYYLFRPLIEFVIGFKSEPNCFENSQNLLKLTKREMRGGPSPAQRSPALACLWPAKKNIDH
jgi:hypothetical protein